MARATVAKRRNKLKIRSADQVKVTAGKDRGKTGKVLRVEPAKERLFVEGLNMVKRRYTATVNPGRRAQKRRRARRRVERRGRSTYQRDAARRQEQAHARRCRARGRSALPRRQEHRARLD